MGEEIIAAVVGVGVIAAVLLTLGIIPLVLHYRLTHGLTAAAVVTEHITTCLSAPANGIIPTAHGRRN